jgi:quinol monooxygenase YgiN
MSITVVATITPADGHRQAVRAARLEAVPRVHGEPGCELYSLHEAADRFVMVERWSSRETLQGHSAGPAVAELGRRFEGRVTGPADVVVLDPVPAGDPGKGTLGR